MTPFHLDALKGILLIEIQITIWLYYIDHKNFVYENTQKTRSHICIEILQMAIDHKTRTSLVFSS